ncbi:MAG TPA: hypothetical protein VGH89_19440 [Pseudonocardia sp.]|jgi:hypothetical protein
MFPLATGAALKTAVALTAATAGAALLTGTASAATPAPATSTTAAVTQPASDLAWLNPGRRAFRVHFRTYDQCVFFANHDRSPRTNGWDCRRGGDRNFPWEYWY